MGTKPDFTQKLLHDLRLRRERMAGAQTSDAFKGSSRDIFKPAKGSKTIQTIGQKNGSTHSRGFSSSHNTTQQSVNQIVPFGEGHHSAQKGDLSMAIAYSFDNGGNLKAFELQSNAAMMNLLQQISKRSMQQTSNMQEWQSTNQFPTLTHLHIDEVARGAQKLNQILKACTSGLNIEKGSVEVGKELWKGAIDLEQSLRMLVSLQEASSNCIIKPQKKSRLKLLEEGEDCDDDDSGITIAKQKQVERPVFSFDRTSRNTKGCVQTDVQQQKQAQNVEPAEKSEKQAPMILKGSHRRSASCGPEFQPPHLVSPSKPKHTTPRLPNVIAKLMGLEEVPQHAEPKPSTEVRTWPKHRSGESVLKTSHGNSRSAELRADDDKDVKVQVSQNRIESTKIAILMANTHGMQEERAYTMTSMNDNYYYRTTLDPQKNTWKEERTLIKNCVRDAQEVIYKVNELQHQMKQPSGRAGNAKNTKTETEISNTTQKPGVKNAEVTLPKALEIEKRSSEVPTKMKTVSLLTCSANRAGDKAANNLSVNQQKKKMGIQLQLDEHPTIGPQGKKPKTQNNTQHTSNNKSQQRKKSAHQPKTNSFQTVTYHSKNLQKRQNDGQSYADGGSAANALLTSRQNSDPATENPSTNSEFKEKSSTSMKSGQNVHSTSGETDSQACTSLTSDTQPASVSRRKVESEQKAQRRKHTVTSVKANEIMAKTINTATKVVRKKSLKEILHGQKPKKLGKLAVPGGSAEQSDSTSKSIQENVELCSSPKHEKTKDAKSEHMSTTKQPHGDESYILRDERPPSDRSEFTVPPDPDSQSGQQLVAGDDHESKPQKGATGKDEASTYHNPLQEQQRHSTTMKQEPLTEDEINLKQKLIQSNLFLNTAEALFKLHIPIGILNYASDQINIDKHSNLILDCGYELLRKKGRKKEMSLYPNISKVMKCTEVRSLDDLVRQMQKDFETLRSYGRCEKEEFDEVEYLLKMLERDMLYTAPDLNCMWDLGWNDTVFAYTDANEVIRDVEQSLLDKILDETLSDWF
ncbi:hypothetical protein vseg_020471 [Gypsophila vaccaria]